MSKHIISECDHTLPRATEELGQLYHKHKTQGTTRMEPQIMFPNVNTAVNDPVDIEEEYDDEEEWDDDWEDEDDSWLEDEDDWDDEDDEDEDWDDEDDDEDEWEEDDD